MPDRKGWGWLMLILLGVGIGFVIGSGLILVGRVIYAFCDRITGTWGW